jgi:hypothetical protein
MPKQAWRVRVFTLKLLQRAWTVSGSRVSCVCDLGSLSLFRFRFLCPTTERPVWCGSLRDSQGNLILDASSRVQPLCVSQQATSSCPSTPSINFKPIPTSQKVADNESASIAAVRSDNTSIATFDIPPNTVSEVTFVVAPVPDSVFQTGSFATLFASGRLRSPLVAITPDAIVDTRAGGITLTLVVDVPSGMCINATANMKVIRARLRRALCVYYVC